MDKEGDVVAEDGDLYEDAIDDVLEEGRQEEVQSCRNE